MIITLDGPAGAGKSTVSRCYAEKYNISYINSGAFYRSVGYVAQSLGDVNESQSIPSSSISTYISYLIPSLYWQDDSIIIRTTDPMFHTLPPSLNEELFSPTISTLAAHISKIQEIRIAINMQIRKICSAKNTSWITEGRDAGSIIFPDTPYKFYLDASIEVRARRRQAQSPEQDFESILQSIRERDAIDSDKGSASLKILDTAIYIETSNLSIDEILEKMYNIVNNS